MNTDGKSRAAKATGLTAPSKWLKLLQQKRQHIFWAWDQFWFAPQDLLGLACMRVVLGATMTYMYLMRSMNLSYFTDGSWISRSQALQIFPEAIRPGFIWFFWPDTWNLPMHGGLVVLLLLLTLGIGGRWIMWFAWVIDMGFIQRNYAVNFGADIICSLFLFYMSFTQSCERLSFLNILGSRRKKFKQSDFLSSVMIRMMQVQICVIYAYTGFEKLKGGSWWDGTALWSVIANPQMVAFDMSFMRQVPSLIAVFSFLTVIFEIYFTPAIFSRKLKVPWMLAGVALHLGIGIMMGLMPFSLAMLSTYFLFINPLSLRRAIVLNRDHWKNLFGFRA